MKLIMKSSDIFYSLAVEDIQIVALDRLNRTLTVDELSAVIPKIEDSIPWFEIIDTAIGGKVHGK